MIQYEDNGKSPYSGDYKVKYNAKKHQKTCVADRTADAVVHVNQAGKLRSRFMQI